MDNILPGVEKEHNMHETIHKPVRQLYLAAAICMAKPVQCLKART
jgi:hypothetical protein